MNYLLLYMDLLGTIAFAVSGAITAIRKNMDIFGVIVLAVVTATGGGLLRDVIIGDVPPVMFRNPFYVGVAAVTAVVVFTIAYFHPQPSQTMTAIYDILLFWFDTLGMAAFTVDGVVLGIEHGYRENLFLLVFVAEITGVGGGMIRDILGNQIPDILCQHVYALASIAGGLVCGILVQLVPDIHIGMAAGFLVTVMLRWMAAHFQWNLPRVS